MHEITTSIEIQAPPSRVWSVLVDFPRMHGGTRSFAVLKALHEKGRH